MDSKLKMISLMFCFLVLVLGPPAQTHASPTGPVDEIEPNNSSGEAQTLAVLGRENYVNAAISPAGDQDWYKFSAEAGVTYVIELFEVSASVNNGSDDYCAGGYNNDEGIGLIVYDLSLTRIADSCQPNDYNSGAGNVHNILEFSAGLQGIYYLRLLANSNVVTGNYKLRVLPDYLQGDASWDGNYEPNNRRLTAAELPIGPENAISTNIEARIVNYGTNFVDVDWYHFEATANQAYTIELFNVDLSFNNGSDDMCAGGYNNDEGIGLVVYDFSGTYVSSSCEPNDYNSGSGNVHNILQFTPGLDGTYFIKVIPNHEDLNGNYSLRVLPQYDHLAASWDSNYEPNNTRMNAAELLLGRENAISTNIEVRILNYATNFVDKDWYRFAGEANETYTIELFNVDLSFNSASDDMCAGGYNNDEGIGMIIYDSSGTQLASSCQPNDYSLGGGNVHNILQFTPGLAGTYFIKVIPNHENLNGNYSIRVLPQYNQPEATWDIKFEPNNKPHIASLLLPGQTLSTDIETRLANYATNFVDRDWFRIDATAGETYVIETLNVNTALATGVGTLCQGGYSSRTGLGIRLYDPTLATILALQCSKNGVGNIHTSLSFAPDISGTYYIWILPNSSTVSGSYSIRLGGVDKVYLPLITR